MADREQNSPILVVGLGRFGSSVARTLVELGREVLALDRDATLVQSHAGRLTHVVEIDSTNEEAMRQVGAADFSCAVVAIGSHVEASILSVSVLVDLGVQTIWAKAITKEHGRILERVGATKVILPEHEMGERVGHLVAGRAINWIEFDDGFALVESAAPQHLIGRSLGETGVRSKHGVTVVCIKRRGEDFTYATADTVVEAGDLLVVAGRTTLAEKFAALS